MYIIWYYKNVSANDFEYPLYQNDYTYTITLGD